jgi:hypothetical protein
MRMKSIKKKILEEFFVKSGQHANIGNRFKYLPCTGNYLLKHCGELADMFISQFKTQIL